MIQRIQTLYMLIAMILAMTCLCLPIGTFIPNEIREPVVMYNLGMLSGTATHEFDFSTCVMLIILLAACSLTLMTVFMYKNRRRQAMMCGVAIVMLVVWYVLYVVFGITKSDAFNARFSIRMAAALPAVSLILTVLARRAILKDEALVRAADRIR